MSNVLLVATIIVLLSCVVGTMLAAKFRNSNLPIPEICLVVIIIISVIFIFIVYQTDPSSPKNNSTYISNKYK